MRFANFKNMFTSALRFKQILFLLFCSNLDEMIFHECVSFMESILDKSAGKQALEMFYTQPNGPGSCLILVLEFWFSVVTVILSL